jgi:hypothetical protein
LQAKVWSPNGGLTEENMQNTLSFYQDNLEMDMNLTVESVADLSHLNAVLDEMGRK